MNKQQQSGFTLIELVVVIVILGILAATAIPRFVDLRDDASVAAAAGVAGGLSSAAGINRAACQVNPNNAAQCTPLSAATATCDDIGQLLTPAATFEVGAIPTTTDAGTLYMTTAANIALTQAGVVCNFTYGDGGAGATATFTGLATAP